MKATWHFRSITEESRKQIHWARRMFNGEIKVGIARVESEMANRPFPNWSDILALWAQFPVHTCIFKNLTFWNLVILRNITTDGSELIREEESVL